MSLDRLTRPSISPLYVIRCDECGDHARSTAGRERGFISPSAALDSPAITDWRTDRTGTPSLCPGCAAAADCESYGHDFGDWYACRCNGSIAWHAEQGCPDYRYCLRCGVNDHPSYPDTTPAARREVA